ncbi:hypothetical protein CHUAL_008585 [Chamberlinius hualienensis]
MRSDDISSAIYVPTDSTCISILTVAGVGSSMAVCLISLFVGFVLQHLAHHQLVAQSIALTWPIIGRRKCKQIQQSKQLSIIKFSHGVQQSGAEERDKQVKMVNYHQIRVQSTNNVASIDEESCGEDDDVKILSNQDGHGFRKRKCNCFSRQQQSHMRLSNEIPFIDDQPCEENVDNHRNKHLKLNARQLPIDDEQNAHQVGCSDQLNLVDNSKNIEKHQKHEIKSKNSFGDDAIGAIDELKPYDDLDLYNSEDETDVLVIEKPIKSLNKCYYLMWTLDNIASTMAIGVTFVFWVFLFKQQGLTAVSLHTHGINAIYVIVDLLLSQRPRQLCHVYQPIAFGVTYVLFSAIYWSLGGTDPQGRSYVYTFLNWEEKPFHSVLFGFVFAVAVAAIIYVILYVIYRLRVFAHQKFSQRNRPNSISTITF